MPSGTDHPRRDPAEIRYVTGQAGAVQQAPQGRACCSPLRGLLRQARPSQLAASAWARLRGGLTLPGVWIHAGAASGVPIPGGLLYIGGALSCDRRWPDPYPSVFG
jgi:hypothetical protein